MLVYEEVGYNSYPCRFGFVQHTKVTLVFMISNAMPRLHLVLYRRLRVSHGIVRTYDSSGHLLQSNVAHCNTLAYIETDKNESQHEAVCGCW